MFSVLLRGTLRYRGNWLGVPESGVSDIFVCVELLHF